MVYSELLKLSLNYNSLVRDLKANTKPNKTLEVDNIKDENLLNLE